MSKVITEPYEENGKKYYPCASYEYSINKLGYWCAKLGETPVEDMTSKQKDGFEKVCKLFCEAEDHVHDGIMYMAYPEFAWAKEAIARYNTEAVSDPAEA